MADDGRRPAAANGRHAAYEGGARGQFPGLSEGLPAGGARGQQGADLLDWRYLVELGDRLRELDDPAEMARAASEIMVRALSASRAGHASVDRVAGTIEIGPDWSAPGVASLHGTHLFSADAAYVDAMTRGETLAFADTAQHPYTASQAKRWRAGGAIAAVTHPILEQGKLVALFFVHQAEPRAWSDEDAAFVRNVADRTWSSMQRCRAEISLRALAASLEQQVAERTADRNRLWQLSSDLMLVVRFDGIVTSINPAWTTVLGWAAHEVVGSTLVPFIHPDDLERTVEAADMLEQGTAVPRFDNRYRHKDGGYRWISWASVPGGGAINACGRDITDEKEKAAALELSEGRTRSIFETTYQFQGLITTDGSLLDANPISLAAIEARLEDVVGMKFWAAPWFSATQGMPELVEQAVGRVAAGETFRQEVVVNLPTGRRAFDFAMRPVINAAGTVIAIVPEAMELTERRATEEQLRQAQKMEAVGQLTGGLAHDFNNLLTGITGGLSLLRTRLAQGRLDEAERYIAAAEVAAGRAASLTHRLLAFSRQQTLDPRTIQANVLVADMRDLIQRTVGPHIDVTSQLAADLWPTRCDPNQLESALLNLAINARDAMPEGGKLVLHTENRTIDERAARERDMAAGDYVSIAVADSGCGMAPDIIAKAFDPFFTTKPIGQGTGLGLSMIYGFARQSGGQVRIHSVIGEGTTVRLHLPRHTGPVQPEQPAAAADAPATRAGETILVVDDEPMVAMLITDILEDLGYVALDAADGPSGLEILRSDRDIDLLITDVGLPGGMNGRQLAEAARQARPELKILFVTGYAEYGVLSDLQAVEGMRVVTKPFEMQVLATTVSAMLAS
jgi:PAS domain S-box-containing protein